MCLDDSFADLITHQGFDRYQLGLIARWQAHRIGYSLSYGEPTSKPSMGLDYETADAIGRVTLWESGECDLEVIDATTGADLLREHHVFKTPREFFDAYPKVPLLLRKLRGDVMPSTK
ncbi:MAG: hypothetical protein Q8M07_01500 [Prosthecobacter sp.]|nr:hypothetical protein [Prosthecobacter sp.]